MEHAERDALRRGTDQGEPCHGPAETECESTSMEEEEEEEDSDAGPPAGSSIGAGSAGGEASAEVWAAALEEPSVSIASRRVARGGVSDAVVIAVSGCPSSPDDSREEEDACPGTGMASASDCEEAAEGEEEGWGEGDGAEKDDVEEEVCMEEVSEGDEEKESDGSVVGAAPVPSA